MSLEVDQCVDSDDEFVNSILCAGLAEQCGLAPPPRSSTPDPPARLPEVTLAQYKAKRPFSLKLPALRSAYIVPADTFAVATVSSAAPEPVVSHPVPEKPQKCRLRTPFDDHVQALAADASKPSSSSSAGFTWTLSSGFVSGGPPPPLPPCAEKAEMTLMSALGVLPPRPVRTLFDRVDFDLFVDRPRPKRPRLEAFLCLHDRAYSAGADWYQAGTLSLGHCCCEQWGTLPTLDSNVLARTLSFVLPLILQLSFVVLTMVPGQPPQDMCWTLALPVVPLWSWVLPFPCIQHMSPSHLLPSLLLHLPCPFEGLSARAFPSSSTGPSSSCLLSSPCPRHGVAAAPLVTLLLALPVGRKENNNGETIWAKASLVGYWWQPLW